MKKITGLTRALIIAGAALLAIGLTLGTIGLMWIAIEMLRFLFTFAGWL